MSLQMAYYTGMGWGAVKQMTKLAVGLKPDGS